MKQGKDETMNENKGKLQEKWEKMWGMERKEKSTRTAQNYERKNENERKMEISERIRREKGRQQKI